MLSRGKVGIVRKPCFLPETVAIRESDWTVAPPKCFDHARAFRLTGLEGYLAARDWVAAESASRDAAGDAGVVSVIVVVDTLAATFEADEILHELRAMAVALELSPKGYLFNFVKTFSTHPECVLPDRADLTLSTQCLRSYVRYVIETAGRRNALVLNADDYKIEPSFAGDERITAADLLQVPRGRITEEGVRDNIRLVLQQLVTSSAGQETGAAITETELARAQLWQWVHHETGVLDSGRIITKERFDDWLAQELATLTTETGADSASAKLLQVAATRLRDITHADAIAPALVERAYRAGE